MLDKEFLSDDPRMVYNECQWAGCEELAEPGDTLCPECAKTARIETDDISHEG